MSDLTGYVIAGVISVLVTIYLVYALVAAERF